MAPKEAPTAENKENSSNGDSEKVKKALLLRRPSVLYIRDQHPHAVIYMQDRFPDADEHDLIRFLEKNNFNVEKAAQMYQAHLDWRQATLPIPFDTVKDTLATRKFYLLEDADALDHPVFVYCLRRYKEAPYNIDDELRALVYLIENEVVPRMGDSFESQQWTVLLDASGIKSPPIYFLEQVNSVMKANYPNRLFRSIMFPVPGWLQKVISSLLSFVDDDTRSKFTFVNDIKSLEAAAMMPREEMGPDVAELIQNKKL